MGRVAILALAGAVGAGLIGGVSYAQGQRTNEEYVSTADVTMFIQEPIPGADGKQVTISRAAAAPGWVGGKHRHSGPTFVYVLKGAFTVDEEGGGGRTFGPGEIYKEPVGRRMQARNTSATEPLEILVIQVSGKGEPLMYKAE
jgi:quercetin dioxygenase-like cupin family protein